MSFSNDHFYEELTGFVDFQKFSQPHHYHALPSNWLVIITDIADSTRAIHEGRYKDINALGTASIVAVLNAIKPLNIPYLFGGDGATFCVPASQQQKVAAALLATKQLAADQFGFTLRVGAVPIATIEAAGYKLRVGKYQPNNAYQQAMFAGNGLGYAEHLVKNGQPDNPFLIAGSGNRADGDFSGFECRWNEIPSPHEEIITLLVQALETNEAAQQRIYQHISAEIIAIYGNESRHHPLRQQQLTLGASPTTLATEIKIRTAQASAWKRWLYALKLPLLVIAGQLLTHLGLKEWGLYKQRLIANTDYRKFDEVLRMVISGTATQRTRLRELLEDLHKDGKIIFGLHASPTALITCIISDYQSRHIHFLDGSNGGYALAAQELKRQKKAISR